MPSDGDESNASDENEYPLFDEQAASLRDATESGPLFDEEFRPGDLSSAGLLTGTRADPVLVAGVGYPLLGDLALGTVVAYRAAEWGLSGVAVADCSHTPIAAYQTITAGDHETVVLVGAEKRGGELNDGTPSETPGAVHEYDAADYEVPEDEIVERIGESAMGSNTIENVVVVSKSLGELPDDTLILTVEPGYDSWGMNVGEFTEPVEATLDEVLDRVLEYVEESVDVGDGVDGKDGVEPSSG